MKKNATEEESLDRKYVLTDQTKQTNASTMSLSTQRKRKVDSENRQFNSEWTDKYAFIAVNAKPVCLICNECIAVCKDFNLRRHFKTAHAKFDTSFPPGSVARREKISALTSCYEQRRRILFQTSTDQERTTAASLRVAWILGKKKSPFTYSETVKECMLASIEEAVADEKTRKNVLDIIKQIPLSDTTNMRRVECLASDVFETLLDKLRKAEVMSLAVDESTDNSDVAQLCLYVRFFDGECFREDLLGLIPMEGRTTGEILFNKITTFFTENNLDLARINMLLTDGAPSMAGREQGLAARMTAVAPQLRSLHCLIHQSLLCAKLSGELKKCMDTVMAIINFVRCNSSLQHRLFRQLLIDMSAEHSDLLIQNDIRWLSKGNALKRFNELREEILVFLWSSGSKKAANFLPIMENEEFNATVCFLSDVFQHLNQINTELQGRGKTVVELAERLTAFQRKLSLFSADLRPGKMLHFPALRTSGLHITQVMSSFIDSLRNNFATRFSDFSIPTEVLRFVKDPFSVDVETDFGLKAKEVLSTLDEGSLQLELIDIQSTDELRQSFQQAGFEKFWTHAVSQDKFPHSRNLALFLLTMFGSTYTCESSFSHMNAIKTHNRISLTDQHLHHSLRIALTSYTPDFTSLAKSKKCHFSH